MALYDMLINQGDYVMTYIFANKWEGRESVNKIAKHRLYLAEQLEYVPH